MNKKYLISTLVILAMAGCARYSSEEQIIINKNVEELKKDIGCIAKLDFIFAKAKLSKSLNAITPIINDNKEINLINARHPLIDPDKVVPITVELGNNFSTLLLETDLPQIIVFTLNLQF